MKSLLFKIGVGVSVATNLFFISLASYTHLTQDTRVKENRDYMKKVIEKEVYDQIKFVMPKETSGVYVPSK